MIRSKKLNFPEWKVSSLAPQQTVGPDNKIRQLLEVLLLYDPSIEAHDVLWEFNGKTRTIKKFEEFPYYLYKAIWDEDFKVSDLQ